MPLSAGSPRVKSLNYLNNILAKIEAANANALEAIMLDNDGYIVECTADNFFALKRGILFTPPTYQGALRGITRDAVIEVARNCGIEVREERLSLYEAYTADEVFITGTAAEVMPIIAIDKRRIGDGKPGRVTKELNLHFRALALRDGVSF
jgi:branched-chain amino acid aminotransferase